MPGVTVAGDALLRAIAAVGLSRGARPETIVTASGQAGGVWPDIDTAAGDVDEPPAGDGRPTVPLDGHAWEQLLAGVRVQRMQGMLAHAVDVGLLPVSDAQRAEVEAFHRDAVAWTASNERALLLTAEQLAAAGIGFAVLKGAAVAHLDYPEPAMRVFGDADLLVRGDDLGRAVELLTAAGFARPRPEARRGVRRRSSQEVELVGPEGGAIGLHCALAPEPFGRFVDVGALLGEGAAFDIAGRTLRALPRAWRFLQACFTAVLGTQPVRLVPLRDAAGIATADGFDWEEAVELAERCQAGAVVARAVGLAWRAFGLDPEHPFVRWAVDRPETTGEHELLAPFSAESRQPPKGTLATLRCLDTPGARITYLRSMLRPGRRGGDGAGRSRTGLRSRGRGALRKLRLRR